VGSNNDGTRTFWTLAIPDGDVTAQIAAGKAEMRVDNLAIEDYHTLGNAIGPNFDNEALNDPAVVSFDVVWSNPITRHVDVTDGSLGDDFAGNFVEDQVTVTWSGTNLATGFSFTSNPGTLATSFVDGGFSELGKERNGIFFTSDSGDSVKADAVLSHALAGPTATPANATTALAAPQTAAGSGTIALGSQPVQVVPGPAQPPAGAGQAPAIDQLFADLSGGLADKL
jgi:hypothetical protein